MYRDEEDQGSHTSRNLEASSIARSINSVFFDRSSPVRGRDTRLEYEPDTVWRNLQRRERTLQKELQVLLDAQSAGLAANLGPGEASSARSDISDAGTSVRTPRSTDSPARRSRITFEEPTHTTPSGALIPVRQPRKKPIGLRGARAGLDKNITLLADLKAEEDASLTAALSTRKKALLQLRKLSARREGITQELRALDAEEEEPLARELRDLGEERDSITSEIAELEERLIGLRNRRRWLNGRIEDVGNRREAGLSGYKGALKEVEGQVSALLSKPPIRPLDVGAFASFTAVAAEDGSQVGDTPKQSSGGAEFLRLRPQRRTLEMARDWWESEVDLLERRKEAVDRERVALEKGVEVWRRAVRLVTDFEADLRREMGTSLVLPTNSTESASPSSSAGQAMQAQYGKMGTVIDGLEELLHLSEDKGWNLLICAIAAELAAFKEAQQMLREALRGAGFEVGTRDAQLIEGEETYYTAETTTPRLGRSTSNLRSFAAERANDHHQDSLAYSGRSFKADTAGLEGSGTDNTARRSDDGLDGHPDDDAHAAESDNEVPADLLFSQPPVAHDSPTLSREDSENEVPLEFLAQHHSP